MAVIRRKLGCLLMVVLGCAGLTISLIAGAAWFIRSTLLELDSSPKPLPVPEITEQSEKQILAIDEALRKIIDNGESGEVIVRSDLLNGWLRTSRHPFLRFVGDHCWMDLAGERLTAQLAVPLDPIGIQKRYLNGEIKLSGGIDHSKVRLLLHSVSIDGAVSGKIGWISHFFVGRDISETLTIAESIDPQVLERCSIGLKTSTLQIRCAARVGTS